MKKLSFRVLALALSVLLTAAAVTATTAFAADPDEGYGAPYVATFSKSSVAGQSVTFSEGDFLEHVVGDAQLEGIVITALPLPGAGVLCVGERQLMVGEAVTTAGLSSLYFRPAGVGDLSSNFSFVPVFRSGAGVNTTVSVSTLRQQNHAPTAENAEYETIKNIAVTCEFPAADADGDELTYTIVKQPKKGTIEVSPDNPNMFIYTPNKNKTGTDTFTFTATDPSGAISEEVTVKVKITKNAAKMTYADMDGNPAHYAALKLAGEGVLMGQRIGDGYYFSPASQVTRAEFVVLAVTCLGIEVDGSVQSTGFADDRDTPAWVKPYIAAARDAGIVSGVPTDEGRAVFNPSGVISRAEAASVLAKAVDLGMSAASVRNYSDIEFVPVWAEASMSAAAAGGILPVFNDGTLRPFAAVDRADAARMLVGAISATDNR